MAEKDKRSRALLRNLRKQARKGTLSARERKTLLDQESKFRKARRGTAKGVGLGLAAGAAGLLASPAAQKALGAAADRFKSSKADRKASKAEEEKAKAFNELQESATPTADADQAVAQRVMGGEKEVDTIVPASDVDFSDIPSERKLQRERMQEEKDEDRLGRRLERRGGFDPRTGEYVDSDKQKAEDEIFDKEFDEFLDELDYDDTALGERIDSLREGVRGQRNAMSDREIFKMLKKEGSLPGQRGDDYIDSMYYPDGGSSRKQNPFASATPMAIMREIRRDEREGKRDKRADDRIQKQIDFVNKYGGFNPSTGEYVDSAKQIAADEAFDREFDESLPDEEVMALAQRMNRERPGIPISRQPLAAGPRAVEGREMPDPFAPVMTRQGMTLGDMIAMGGPGAETVREERDREFRRREADYEREQRRNFDRDFPGSIPLRQDGPRVQAQGGKVSQADKLRKMIAKKYGIR